MAKKQKQKPSTEQVTPAETTTVKSLGDLGQIAANLKTKVIELGDLPDLSKLGETVAEKISAVKEIRSGIATAVHYLFNTQRQIDVYADDRESRRIAEKLTVEGIARAKKYLDQALTLTDPIYKQAAAFAYVQAVLTVDFSNNKEARAAMVDLEKRELLFKSNNPRDIRIDYDYYKLSDVFGTDKEDLRDLGNVISQFSLCLRQLIAQERDEAKTKALKSVNLTIGQVISDKYAQGTCALTIPKEPFTDRDGKVMHRPDGTYVFKVTPSTGDRNPGFLVPIIGIGGIEGVVNKASHMGIQTRRDQLTWDTPPAQGKAYDGVFNGVLRNLGLDFENTEDCQYVEDYINCMRAIWYLINRGIKAEEAQKMVAESRKEFQAHADISVVQFFGLDAEPKFGTACLEYSGCMKTKGKEVHGLFFLATSKEDGTMMVNEVPEHAKELLGEFVGKSFPIDNCPGDLGTLMKSLRGETQLAVDISK